MFTTRSFTRAITIAAVIVLALSSVQPAFAAGPNDYFADATQIASLPFSTNADTSGASSEPGEPYPPCGYGYAPNSVWFAYVSPTNVTVTARSSNYYSLLAIYTGSAVDSLTQASCAAYYPFTTFQALAGVTYYFQLSTLYGGNIGESGNLPFSLEVTPPPQVGISYYPYDPNVFDNVSFSANTNDPGGIYGFTYAWTISDGATSDQYSFSHQFAADGFYTVNLTATTSDGRSGSASQVVQVRTKDVAITSFSIPQTARVNQTKTINVAVQNKRYSDYVQVTLTKGLPGGGEQVIGTLTIYVPAKAKQGTTFKFSYTFTPDDAAIGKVTFRAVATIVNGRDALPSDNTLIGTTSVSR